MERRDWTDFIGGSLLLVFGLWFLWHAQIHYSFGEMRRMGAGAFPTGLGILISAIGLLILIPAWFRRGDKPGANLRPFLAILAGGLAFAWLIEPAGLVPSIVALVVIVSLAEAELRWLRTLLLAVALSCIGVLIFTKGLGMPIPAFRWWSH
ncbi:tripartite tricarboxylate transporter TctB family protein [Falsiroseomonas sp.]|uniref:tripartite tricarboxylate transporter TctB family protein n=1 Tax=Falsiroseomonas sp. TaxID=2870721 RepID=UPI003F70F4B1